MKKTIAVFFGGQSTEHDISIITAISSVIKPLELSKKYTVIPIYITRSGKWISHNKLKNISFYQSKESTDFIDKAKPVAIAFDGSMVLKKNGITPDQRVDVAFPAMHGLYGEDGSLMGLLRMAGVPFVGADMDASVMAMDKVLAKQVVEANNISTPKFVFFTRDEFMTNQTAAVKTAISKLRFPMFVKPAHLGSSIGISRVTNNRELQNAIEVAAYYDEKIVVEEAVNNLIEVTVPIMGNHKPRPALVEHPLTGDQKFFDFDSKYIREGGKKSGGKQTGSQGYSELPAKLPDKLYDKAMQVALDTYKALGIVGISRVDLLIDGKTKKVYFNEVNPLPGSLYAHNWRMAGVSAIELVDELIKLAEERFDERQKLNTTFSSSFLQQF
jgi:D-alanine-D-alanine ligase